jgi:hypothetical protein
MAAVLGPQPFFEVFDDDGIIVPFAQLHWTLSGTSTPATVWHDAAMTAAWTDPVVCDAAGRALIYFDAATGNLKLRIADALGVFFSLTVDPFTVSAAGGGGGGTATGIGAEVFVFGSDSSSQVSATTIQLGATYNFLHAGTSVWVMDSAILVPGATYVLEVAGLMEEAGTMTIVLVNLTDAPNTPIATATLTSLTGETVQSAAITFPAAGATKSYGVKRFVSANSGFIRGARICRTA